MSSPYATVPAQWAVVAVMRPSARRCRTMRSSTEGSGDAEPISAAAITASMASEVRYDRRILLYEKTLDTPRHLARRKKDASSSARGARRAAVPPLQARCRPEGDRIYRTDPRGPRYRCACLVARGTAGGDRDRGGQSTSLERRIRFGRAGR